MRQSWDGFANEGGYVMREKTGTGHYTIPVRVVPWGECPYPQEQVPQVNEVVKDGRVAGVPFKVEAGMWRIPIIGSHGSFNPLVEDILKLPAPTVEIGGRRLLESEAVECCKELEPVTP